MRDFIVHAKRLDNGEWVEGNLFVPDKPDTPTQICIGTNIVRITYDVDPSTIGWYTGSKDKNGKKIFEGDIIKYKNTDGIKFNGVALTVIGKVVYNEKNASFAISGKDEIGAKHYDYFPIKNIEVIGNIHDNPDPLNTLFII